jgi:rod shape-determining protein MreC
MVLDHQQGTLANLRNGISVAVYPVRFLVNLPFSVARWADDSLASRDQLINTNATLQGQLLQQNARLQKLAALEAENRSLRAMMQSSSEIADEVKVTEIISVALDPFQHRVVIDKGTLEGAYQGQALIDEQGVMGQITRAEPFSSEAILISDPSHAIPVEINRNGLRSIVVGSGEVERLTLPFLPNNADVETGDLLVTSGLGGKFPAGYPVGIVETVEVKPGEPFALVMARPTAALNRSRRMLMIWPTELPEPSLPETELGLEEGMIMTEPDAESPETGIVPEAVPAAESPVQTGADEAAPATTEESE